MTRVCGSRIPAWWRGGWGGWMAVLLASFSLAQTGPPATQAQGETFGRVYRQIRDPHSGARWLVFRDAENPAGPGRAILAVGAEGPGNDAAAELKIAAPVIHPGDKLTVEEHNATVQAYLEGLAAGAAAPGACLDVRLKIGGKTVRAVAIATGRAALASGSQCRESRR
jgi:hypothetical protein